LISLTPVPNNSQVDQARLFFKYLITDEFKGFKMEKAKKNLPDVLRALIELRQMDFFGVANLEEIKIKKLSPEINRHKNYPLAIVIGIALNDEIINQLPNRKQPDVAIAYLHFCYKVINQRLDLVISEMTSIIQKEDYKAYPIPASKRVDENNLWGDFSHKMAAHLSGLGWIGKSCLLITPEVGPRLRFASLLTDAPLEPTKRVIKEGCGSCTKCVDICPVQAFTGREYFEGEPREYRYDAHKCDLYHQKIRKENHWAVCGMCIYVCPYGLNRKQSAQQN
jgi:epoxyqueuosine reductase